MAKKKVEDQEIVQIRTAVEKGAAILGTKNTLKSVRSGTVSRVYMTRNTPAHVQDDLRHLCGLADVQLVELELTNKELGVVCKKPFVISVLAVLQ